MESINYEINDVIRALRLLSTQIQRDIKDDFKGPADLLVSAIKARVPVSDKPHSRYKRVTQGKKKARKGAGVIAATYRPGNLKKSFRVLGKLRRMKNAVMVGALLGGKRVDGYYVHFVNNDVKMPNGKIRVGQRFVDSAVSAAGPIALRAIQQIVLTKIDSTERQTRSFGNKAEGSGAWWKAYARAKGRE